MEWLSTPYPQRLAAGTVFVGIVHLRIHNLGHYRAPSFSSILLDEEARADDYNMHSSLKCSKKLLRSLSITFNG